MVSSRSECLPLHSEPTHFATFYCDDSRWAHRVHPLVGPRGPQPDLLEPFCDAIRSSHPNATLVLLTDSRTSAPRCFDEVIRREVDPEALMLERFRHHRQFLVEQSRGARVAFLDSDCLLVRPLDAFRHSFDFAVTRRTQRGSRPFNNGVLLARTENKAPLVALYEALLTRLGQRPLSEQAWGGNEQVLASLLLAHGKGPRIRVGELRIRVLEASLYNALPEHDQGREVARILHFEGDRKPQMIREARRRISPRGPPMPRSPGRSWKEAAGAFPRQPAAP